MGYLEDSKNFFDFSRYKKSDMLIEVIEYKLK